jgi:hypothetical protein
MATRTCPITVTLGPLSRYHMDLGLIRRRYLLYIRTRELSCCASTLPAHAALSSRYGTLSGFVPDQ